jgi:hypothetical protein
MRWGSSSQLYVCFPSDFAQLQAPLAVPHVLPSMRNRYALFAKLDMSQVVRENTFSVSRAALDMTQKVALLCLFVHLFI